jgi:hypothetical protein
METSSEYLLDGYKCRESVCSKYLRSPIEAASSVTFVHVVRTPS